MVGGVQIDMRYTFMHVIFLLVHGHSGKHMMAIKCFFAAQQIRFQCIHEESDEYVDIGSTLNNIGVCLHALKRLVMEREGADMGTGMG